MCGIVGIVGFTPVNQQIYDALTVLQHRGQDAAGIMTEHEGALYLRKDVGLVRDVFQQRHMLQLKGNIGIGHVRYPTAGTSIRRRIRRCCSTCSRANCSASARRAPRPPTSSPPSVPRSAGSGAAMPSSR